MDSEELRWTEPGDAPGGGTLVGQALDAAEGETDFEPGANLGRYVVLARMGSGGMGVVYAAYDPQLDRRIALKLMHQRGDDEAQAERASRRMLAEAKAMAQLNHPNVISVHDVGTIDGRVFIAMEFVEGVPLSQWMRQPGRDWRQLLEVFSKAGRGLEAAHAVGIVHRDFKPDNVLVGADGRVRVLDFGLARRFDGSRDPVADRRDREAGTPAYMSPEQHLGKPLDHRADQFSFCVALYEALYGELPFAAKTRLELALAVTDGRVGPAPKRAAVPNWLRWALLRGLDPDPDGRWPDMASLLAELGKDPSKLRRTIAITASAAAVVLGLVGGGALAYKAWGQGTEVASDAPTCSSSAAVEIAKVWDDARVTAVREAFAEVDPAWGTELEHSVEARLSAWAQGWEQMHAETCEATLEGRQSAALLDLRMRCLEHHRAHFDQLVEVMTSAEAESLTMIGQAVQELPPLSACEADAVQQERAGPKHTDAEQMVFDQVERDLNHAHALEMTGAFTPARELAASAVATASSLGDQRLVAIGSLTQARIDIALGVSDHALPLLADAELAAERSGADRLRADILMTIARLDAEAGRAAAAAGRVREAHAVLDRVAADNVEYAELAGVEALGVRAAGDLDRAEQIVGDAIASIADLQPPRIELAQLRWTHAMILSDRGQLEQARTELEAARRLWLAEYGEQHPAISRVDFELAKLSARSGDHQHAIASYQIVRTRFEAVYGPDSLELGRVGVRLGDSLAALGRDEEAQREYQRARKILSALGEDAHQALARVVLGEARLASGHGQHEAALKLHREALGLLEGLEPAVPEAELAELRTKIAQDLLALERNDEARTELDAALTQLGAAGVTGERLASARWLAAKLWLGVEPERALAFARQARSDYAALGQSTVVADIDAWLAAN